MGRERRFQKNGIGICRLELADVERRREVVRKDAFTNANRTIEFIVVEKTATTARREHGPVPKRRQRMGKRVVKPARALLEKVIGIRAETCTGKTGQQAEFGLPRTSAENVDVKDSMEAIRWGQKRFDGRFDRKSKNAGIEDQFMLDDDNVGVVDGARRDGRHQRQRVICNIAQRQSAGLPPGMRIDQRSHEGRVKAPPLGHDPLEGNAAAA